MKFKVFKEGFLFHLVNTEMNAYKTFASINQFESALKIQREPWKSINTSFGEGKEIFRTNNLNEIRTKNLKKFL